MEGEGEEEEATSVIVTPDLLCSFQIYTWWPSCSAILVDNKVDLGLLAEVHLLNPDVVAPVHDDLLLRHSQVT